MGWRGERERERERERNINVKEKYPLVESLYQELNPQPRYVPCQDGTSNL